MALDEDKLIQAIDAAESSSYGSDSDSELENDRATAINAYLGKNIWPVPDGRSTVVDRSVFETIQWILPSLCRIFAGGDDIITLPPVGPDDEEASKQEGDYLNWEMTQKNDWFNIFLEWAMDALITKNAYLLANMEQKVSFEMETYENQTPEGLALLLQDKDCEIVESSSHAEENAQPQVDPMTGQPQLDEMGQPVLPMLYDVKLKRVQKDKQLKIYCLPPERIKVSQRTPSWKLRDCDYFEWWEEETLSSLRELGYDVDDDVADDENAETLEDEARDLYDESDPSIEVDPAMRKVRARRIWIKHDADGDGIAELLYVLRVGSTILHSEPCNRVPACSVVPNPISHRHMGQSVADTVIDIQAIRTQMLRSGLDNFNLSNNPYKLVNEQVNLDDALVSRPGAVVRIDGDVNTAMRHETPPQIFPAIMQGLEYMDQIRENRTGTNRYFTGIDQNAMNKTASGVQQLSSMAAQRVEHIARIFGSAIEDIASVCHELILKSGHKQKVVKLRGKWVEVDPSTWRKRTDFRLSAGFAAGNKDAMVGRLMLIANLQEKAAAGGLPIVTPENIYETCIEITKASDFSNPQRFWTDPTQAPPKGEQKNPLAEAEQVKAQAALQKTQMDNASKEAIEQLKSQGDKYKADLDAQVKVYLAQFQAQQATQHKQMDHAHAADIEDSRTDSSFYLESMRQKAKPDEK